MVPLRVALAVVVLLGAPALANAGGGEQIRKEDLDG
jgi:hypothetical protein